MTYSLRKFESYNARGQPKGLLLASYYHLSYAIFAGLENVAAGHPHLLKTPVNHRIRLCLFPQQSLSLFSQPIVLCTAIRVAAFAAPWSSWNASVEPPMAAAICTAVSPLLFAKFGLPPNCRSILRVSVWIIETARCIGVSPSSLAKFGFPPNCNSSSRQAIAAFECPVEMACRALLCLGTFLFGLAPPCSKSLKTSLCPLDAATFTAIAPSKEFKCTSTSTTDCELTKGNNLWARDRICGFLRSVHCTEMH